MRIGLDVMGGDYAPENTIKGAILAHKELSASEEIVLIGDEKQIHDQLRLFDYSAEHFTVVHAPDQISMGELAARSFINKPKSSIAVGFSLLKSGEIDSFASAGNSGAMMVGSAMLIKTVNGILRPTTSAGLPQENGSTSFLLDVGTNPDCKAENLYQFGLLGSLYAHYVHNISNPRVGLLNIGEEDKKGNILTRQAYELMKASNDFNFVGNIEGRDFHAGKADIIVCDGFIGNVILKQTETLYKLVKQRNQSDEFFERFNYENFGGTPILGINKPVIVGHGISSGLAIKNMLLHSKEIYIARLSEKIEGALNNKNNT